MKLNETHKHYLTLFSGYGLMGLIMLISVYLADSSLWFSEFWASKINRILTIFCLPVILLLVGIQVHSYFWGKKKLIRSFKGIPLLAIRHCKDGEKVRIQGKLVSMGQQLIAPLSQRSCAAFSLRALREVDRASTSGSGNVRSEKAWETLKFEQHLNDCLIEYQGDYAYIRQANCEVSIHPDAIHDIKHYDLDQGGFLTPQENTLRERVLKALQIFPRPYIGVYSANIKFEEGVLEDQEQVAVVGQGRWVNVGQIPELAFLKDQNIKKVFEISSNNNVKTHISDAKYLLEKY